MFGKGDYGGKRGRPGPGALPGQISIFGFNKAPKFNLLANEGETF